MARPRLEVPDNVILTAYLDSGKHCGSASQLLFSMGYDISGRTVRRRIKEVYPEHVRKYSAKAAKPQEEKPVASGYVTAPDRTRQHLVGKRFVFTCAQNNTYVHKNFLNSLLTFCKDNNARLYVSTCSYNKSGFQNSTKDSDGLWYDPLIVPYLCNNSAEVADDLIFCGELDILPTAVNPLSGFDSYAQGNSAIIPHTKVRMESLPRMKGEDPRFLYTTGAVTMRNYIQRTAGQKADFHHVFGALYVEIDKEGKWFARQLIADESGAFYDLTNKYTPSGLVQTDQSVASIVWGDIHAEKLDYDVSYGAFLSEGSMLDALKPEAQFIHDLTDFSRRNHHNIDDPHFLAKAALDNRTVLDDIQGCGRIVARMRRTGTKTIVVESNHDQALLRWLKSPAGRTDAKNAEFWHCANYQVYKNIREENNTYNVFAEFSFPNRPKDVIFLREDDSYVVRGIEHGMHGHRGPNGARGNPRGFRCVGKKVNIGHMHSAGIYDGVYVAGVSAKLDMDYNKGPSSWSHSHIVTYKNGKRAIITMRGSKWRA